MINDIVKETYAIYKITAPTSNKKLKKAHALIKADLSIDGFEIYCLNEGVTSGEKTIYPFDGYSKKIDFSCYKDDKLIYVGGTKFIFRNYKQNSNNYFENELGQAYIITQFGKKIPYFTLTVIIDEIPYYKKNGEVKNIEKITTDDFKKYEVFSSFENCYCSVVIYSLSKDTVVGTVGFSYRDMILQIRNLCE